MAFCNGERDNYLLPWKNIWISTRLGTYKKSFKGTKLINMMMLFENMLICHRGLFYNPREVSIRSGI